LKSEISGVGEACGTLPDVGSGPVAIAAAKSPPKNVATGTDSLYLFCPVNLADALGHSLSVARLAQW
jgi:hypothetical protein